MNNPKPPDIIDQLKMMHAVLSGTSVGWPAWFLELEKVRASGGWKTVFEDAITEIERLRGGGGQLEEMRNLAGYLLRRLSDGSDLPIVEQWVKMMEDL